MFFQHLQFVLRHHREETVLTGLLTGLTWYLCRCHSVTELKCTASLLNCRNTSSSLYPLPLFVWLCPQLFFTYPRLWTSPPSSFLIKVLFFRPWPPRLNACKVSVTALHQLSWLLKQNCLWSNDVWPFGTLSLSAAAGKQSAHVLFLFSWDRICKGGIAREIKGNGQKLTILV